MSVRIRRASPLDAAGVSSILAAIAQERVHSAIDKPWSVEQERAYLESLSAREAFHVAEDSDEGLVGFQSLDRWSTSLESMAHVGQVGTFVLRKWRGNGLGRLLWRRTLAFARDHGYEKLVIQVRASNEVALTFYKQLGFGQCGRLRRQVKIDGREDDEILMELFL